MNTLSEKCKKILPKKIKKSLINCLPSYKVSCEYIIDYKKQIKMKDKVAFITGGSGAIGSATSFRLAMEGAKVLFCGRNEEKLRFVKDMICENGGIADYIVCDVSDDDSISNAFKFVVDKFKKIDIMINNAGCSARNNNKYFVEQSMENVDEILRVNLRGTIFCSQKAAQLMIKQDNKGKIINISSVVGMQGKAKMTDYATAKSAILGFTKSLAIELAPYNINVNAVSPGMVNQICFDKRLPLRTTTENYLGRMGYTDEVASLITFLASDEANYITGQNFVIDGGRTLGLKGD